MKFEDALCFLKVGKRIRRRSWKNKDYWLDEKDKDQEQEPCISLKDLDASDWISE